METSTAMRGHPGHITSKSFSILSELLNSGTANLLSRLPLTPPIVVQLTIRDANGNIVDE
jgi:hypothetical protein